MLRLSERLFQFYVPTKFAQVSFRELSVSNFTVWGLGIFVEIHGDFVVNLAILISAIQSHDCKIIAQIGK